MREKMKQMTLQEKLDYLWTYYKIWLFVPLFIGIILHIVYSAYCAGQENNLVSAVVIGAGTSDTEEFESGLKEFMNKTGKNDKVTLQTNIVEGELTPDTTAVLTTLIGAASADVFVCPENIYSQFSSQRAFTDMKEILGDSEEQERGVELSGKGDALIIRNSAFLEKNLGVFYEEVYVAVVDYPQNEEGKKAFVKYILENR